MNYSFESFWATGPLNELLTDSRLFEVTALDQETMKYSWSMASWKAWLESEGGTKLLSIATLDGNLVGFSLWQLSPGTPAELLKIAVTKKQQGSSLATSFWSYNINKLKVLGYREILLEVESSNLRAQRFYQKIGFKELGIRKKFYSDGNDAVSLKLSF
mgnify:CR=1 FL=1